MAGPCSNSSASPVGWPPLRYRQGNRRGVREETRSGSGNKNTGSEVESKKGVASRFCPGQTKGGRRQQMHLGISKGNNSTKKRMSSSRSELVGTPVMGEAE